MFYTFEVKDPDKEREQTEIHMAPLAEYHISDPQYKKWFYDPEVTRYNSHGLFPYTEVMKKELLRSIESGSRTAWAIVNKYESLVGTISLQRIDLIHRSAELAVVIGTRKYWNCGVATEAVKKVLYHAFIVMGLNRVWTGTVVTNEGMRKVCEKIGFHREGVFRHAMWLNGEFVDVINYAVLREQLTFDIDKERKEDEEIFYGGY